MRTQSPFVGSRFAKRQPEADHWHRTENDPGRPLCVHPTRPLLLFDFFAEVERILTGRDVPLNVVRMEETRKRSTT